MSIRGPDSELRKAPDSSGNAWELRRCSNRIAWSVFTADGSRISGIPLEASIEGIRFISGLVPFVKKIGDRQIEWIKRIQDAAGSVFYEESMPSLYLLVNRNKIEMENSEADSKANELRANLRSVS